MIKVTIFTALATAAFVYGSKYTLQSQYELTLSCAVIFVISLWHIKLGHAEYSLLAKTKTKYKALWKEYLKLKAKLDKKTSKDADMDGQS